MLNIYNADAASERLIKTVYKAALKYFNQPDIFEVEIELVDAEEICTVNREERGVDSVTDVLSFPNLEINKVLPVKKSQFKFDVDPDTGKLLLGETLMCMEKITSQAAEYGNTFEREAGYLFLHSLLHLFGYDHMTDDDKAEMRAKEEVILASIGLERK